MGEARVVLSFARDENYCRHSEGDFIRLKDGRILFIYTRFKGAKAGDGAPTHLVRRLSADNGETWTEPEVVFEAEQFGTHNIMSVSLMRMANGDIGIYFIGKTHLKWVNDIYLCRSKDEGETWTEIISCNHPYIKGRQGMNNSRIERLNSGRIIFPWAHHPGAYKPAAFEGDKKRTSNYTVSMTLYSDDDGYTWNASEDMICPPFTNSEKGIQEGEIVEIKPGILRGFWRSDKMYQYTALSFDNGAHWTTPTQSCFTSNCSPITIARNPYTGKLYSFWNPIPLYNGRPQHFVGSGRTPLAMAEISEDANKILKMKDLEDHPDCAYAYVAPFFLNENEVLISYCAGRPEDRHGLSRMSIAKAFLFENKNK